EMQRDMARRHSVIMDGRDIGTVVLPEAEVKIFLTAAAEERARRRCLELEQRGTPQPYDQVLAEIRQRDENDMNRAAAPLKAAEDAVVVDTTELTFDESLQALERVIKERLTR
ncbi:MAG: (d)CMP kinase, partial [Firmicutes bacterium]|nr:(d)CMP kinase [Bacillota bacterium]